VWKGICTQASAPLHSFPVSHGTLSMSYAGPFTEDTEDSVDQDVSLLSRRRALPGEASPQSPLETYLREINETKLLSAEEEFGLTYA
jgi:hypothetical protein